jgi:hypothetical protein
MGGSVYIFFKKSTSREGEQQIWLVISRLPAVGKGVWNVLDFGERQGQTAILLSILLSQPAKSNSSKSLVAQTSRAVCTVLKSSRAQRN